MITARRGSTRTRLRGGFPTPPRAQGRRHPDARRGGEVADRHVRFVFSNEPVERLELLGDRVRAALAPAGGV